MQVYFTSQNLKLKIGKKEGDAEALSSKIKEPSGNIATGQKALGNATTFRNKQALDFVAGAMLKLYS